MSDETHHLNRWTNAQGDHEAVLTLRPVISTRPGCIGLAINEKIMAGETVGRDQTACMVLPYEQAHQLLGQLTSALGVDQVPKAMLRQALELVARATNNALSDDSKEWGEIGHEVERLERYL